MKKRILLMLAFAFLGTSQIATAQNAGCDKQCPIAAAMGELPKMTYKVGEETTFCSESAATLAEEQSQPIEFMVGKKTFETKDAAFDSLVEQTETFVSRFITPHQCETSGKTVIAGESCRCPVEASKLEELVSAAADNIHMTYAVGEEQCNCIVKATEMAKASGDKLEFIVNGKKTCCEMTARLSLSRAKYRAAVESLVASK